MRLSGTVHSKKYAHGFVVLCFVVVMQSFIINSHEVFIHIHQGCFAGTGAIVRLPQCQWSKPDGYGKISQCITTTKHSKAKTVCIFLGIYCSHYTLVPKCYKHGLTHWRNRSTGVSFTHMTFLIINGLLWKVITLRWRHNGRDSVSNHQPRDCLLNRLFRHRSKKTSKLRVTGLCVGNSPGTGEFPAQMSSYAENVSIWWRHHDVSMCYIKLCVI